MIACQIHNLNILRDRSKGWSREDSRGRLVPGRLAGLLRLMDDSLSLPTTVLAG